MRAFAWGCGGIAFLAATQALVLLLDPYPARGDLAGFALVGIALFFGYLAAAWGTRPAWWHWWIPGAWIGLAIAALTLAYKDTFLLELRVFGPLSLAWQMFLHALIAPVEILFGFVIGFVEPDAPLYVLASLAVSLLGTELVRRRLWPRAGPQADPAALRR